MRTLGKMREARQPASLVFRPSESALRAAIESFTVFARSETFPKMDTICKVQPQLIGTKNKGTGKWSTIAAMEYGVPVTLIGEAVFARCLSSLKDERTEASRVLHGPGLKEQYPITGTFLSDYEKDKLVDEISHALYAAKIVSYTQGFMLFREAAKQNHWNLNYGGIALMWRGGCIIRSAFLADIKNAFHKHPNLSNLLLDDFFRDALRRCQDGWRQVVATAVLEGTPVPTMSSALAFYDGFRLEKLPANLLQAQRDYFGAHTYETLDFPGKFVHTNWTGTGGTTASSTYQV